MKAWIVSLALLASTSVDAAPAKVDIGTYRALAAQDLRLATIGYRLASANSRFCAVKGYNPGWVIHDIAQYPDEAMAKAAFGFATPLAVSGVVADGPAAKAGVRAGDAIVELRYTVNGYDWTPGQGQGYSRVAAYKALLAEGWKTQNGPETIFRRDGNDVALRFQPGLVCASDFQVDTKNKADAGADGAMVSVTTGMMDFASNDGELAAAVAHELAHNILGHRQRLLALGRKKKNSDVKATEVEADRLSIWLLANAGYDLDTALKFWERWGQQFATSDATHPRWKDRIASMKQEMALIARTAPIDGLLPPPMLTLPTAQ